MNAFLQASVSLWQSLFPGEEIFAVENILGLFYMDYSPGTSALSLIPFPPILPSMRRYFSGSHYESILEFLDGKPTKLW
jgi:hypothetical protein